MTTVVAWTANKALGAIVGKLRVNVMERLAKHRQNAFVESLSECFRDEIFFGESEESLNRKLDEMVKKESLAEAVFEAFRRVSLSRSREVGPRIIGYITAGILAEDRQATEDEDRWFDAAESMSDSELGELVRTFEEWEGFAKQEKAHYAFDRSGVMTEIDRQSMDDSRQGNIDTTSLTNGMDGWMRKLVSLGLVYERTLDERDMRNNRDSGMGGIYSGRTVTRWLVIAAEVRPLIELIKRAQASLTKNQPS